jgi:hypothetical protein
MELPAFVEVVEHRTAIELLAYIRLADRHWGDGWNAPWIFRGHADADWRLIPPSRRPDGQRILRPLIEAHLASTGEWTIDDFDLASRSPELVKQDASVRSRLTSAQTRAEGRAIREFVILANELGLRIEDDVYDLPSNYREPTFGTALAQHHGVPTPLLDWTRNPLVAAYFAAAEDTNGERIAVWALNTELACAPPNGPPRFDLHTFECPRFAHAFLHAQAGLFTWVQDYKQWNFMIHHGFWPSMLDTLSEFDVPPGCMRCITLPRAQLPELRQLLWRERVSRAHLMPTFDNVRAALAANWPDQHKMTVKSTAKLR